MNGTEFLLDTNAVWFYLRGDQRMEVLLDGAERIYLSVIGRMELLCTPDLDGQDEALLDEFIKDCTLIELMPSIQDEAVRLRKANKLKLPDAVIAATAKYLNRTLVTADKRFTKLGKDVSILFLTP